MHHTDPTLAALYKAIIEKAERQEHFASPVYHHFTDEDRRMFRHAAKMLRDVAKLVEKEVATCKAST